MFLKIYLKLLNINWLSLRPADCFPKHCFCEEIDTGFIRQPIDAYSNIIYVLVGLYIIANLIYFSKKRLRLSPHTNLPRKILYIFALASIAVGIGSFIYHAGFTFLGEQLDDDSMYLAGSFLLLNSLSHLKKITVDRFFLLYVLINLFLEILIYIHPVVRGTVFGLLILAALLIEKNLTKKRKDRHQIKNLLLGIKLFVAGYIIWILDYTRILCFPTSIFQGHAVWHILTGLAILFIYFSMDTEYINNN